jgi:flagellar protein FlaJ|tara:strand:+ start:13642 stop:14478 length:837 start_codon:yes stop_codon:yes gene_type:complete
MKIKKFHWSGAILGLIIIVASFFLFEKFFFLMVGIGLIIAVVPFVFLIIQETRITNEKEQMFLEFARNLAESVKTGTPISKSILNVKNKPYGALSKHIQKLSNQIYLGIPLVTALQIFSRDIGSKTISRAITLIGQAEKSGGDIGEILDSVAGAVNETDKLKKERKAVISTLVVQGYIIFLVFLVIVLVLQFRIIPMISGIGDINIGSATEINQDKEMISIDASNAFLYLLLIQGFFSGLTIGKLSEKNLKAGIKHSFVLMVLSFSVSSGANFFFAAV